MSDGELRMYEAHDLDLLASARDFLTAPVETGFWARPHVRHRARRGVRNRLGRRQWYLQLDDHDLETVESWDVAGNPTKVAFVGILGDAGGHPGSGA